MAGTVAEPPSRTELEDWFIPCTRLQAPLFFGHPQRGTLMPPGFQQDELILDEGFSDTTWNWEDMYAFTRNKIVWFRPTEYIDGTFMVAGSSGDYRHILRISNFDKEKRELTREVLRVLNKLAAV